MPIARPAPPPPFAPDLRLPRRPLGRTGFDAAIIGAGDVADRALGKDACLAVLERAVARGCNVLDTAPAYEDGLSEILVGHLVRDKPRSAFFVIDKVDHLRTDPIPQLDASLFRSRLDLIDLGVFHGVNDMGELERLLIPGGGFDRLDIARREKLIRFRGVSSHHPDVVAACIDGGRCDVVMFPIGPFVDPRYPPLIARARERSIGTVCFKTFGAGKLLGPTSGYSKPLPPEAPESARRLETRLDAARCIRYSMTLDPDVVLLGMSTIPEVETAIDTALAFAPMSAGELRATEADAALAVAGKGRIWWNPEG